MVQAQQHSTLCSWGRCLNLSDFQKKDAFLEFNVLCESFDTVFIQFHTGNTMHHISKLQQMAKIVTHNFKKWLSLLGLALLGLQGIGLSHAQESANNMLVYSVIGTGGLGLGLGKEMSNGFVIRGEVTSLSKSIQTTQDGNNFSGNFNLTTSAVYADYHPWKSAFHLSTGVNFKPTNISLTGTPTSGRITLGSTSYPVSAGQGINAIISFPTTMPYLGMGWGFGDLSKTSGMRFSTDMGFDFGKMNGVITATPGLLAGFQGTNIASDLNTQSQKLSNSVSALRFFPIIKFQVGYAY
jgi:hypothetical protein